MSRPLTTWRSIEQALTLDPNLAETWFTKAIVLERLQIRQQAREAWTTYLQLDPDSGWSAEARRRLAALESSTRMRAWSEIERALRDPAEDDGVIREAVSRDPMEFEIMPPSATDVEGEKAAVQRHPCDFGTPPVSTPQRRVPPDSEYCVNYGNLP